MRIPNSNTEILPKYQQNYYILPPTPHGVQTRSSTEISTFRLFTIFFKSFIAFVNPFIRMWFETNNFILSFLVWLRTYWTAVPQFDDWTESPCRTLLTFLRMPACTCYIISSSLEVSRILMIRYNKVYLYLFCTINIHFTNTYPFSFVIKKRWNKLSVSLITTDSTSVKCWLFISLSFIYSLVLHSC